MPRITKISPQKRKGRCNIFLNGKFAFGLDEDTLVSENLKTGQKLTQFEVEELEKKSDLGKLMQKALRFLEVRPRSEFEIRQYLKRKIWQSKTFEYLRNSEEGEAAIESILSKLKLLKFLNDEEFTRWWIEQRRGARHPKGIRFIKAELLKKGIPREIIQDKLEATVNKLPRDQTFSEEELAFKAAQKKLKTYQNLLPWEFKRKLGAYLARRGFDWEVIKEVLQKIVDKKDSFR